MTPEPRGASDSMEKGSEYGSYSPQRHQQYMPQQHQQPSYGTDPRHDPYRFAGSVY